MKKENKKKEMDRELVYAFCILIIASILSLFLPSKYIGCFLIGMAIGMFFQDWILYKKQQRSEK